MQCVILAGGLGSRLKPFTDSNPKSLVPILGRPFLFHQLDLVAKAGVTRVLLCIGHLGDKIRDAVGESGYSRLPVEFCDEKSTRLGTGGALRKAFDEGFLDDKFFVLYGDSYLPIHFNKVALYARSIPQPALMTLYRNRDPLHPNNVRFRDGKVELYEKNAPPSQRKEMAYMDYGLSVLSSSLVEQEIPSDQAEDLASVFSRLSVSGKLAGYEVTEPFYEVGTVSGVRGLEKYLCGNPL